MQKTSDFVVDFLPTKTSPSHQPNRTVKSQRLTFAGVTMTPRAPVLRGLDCTVWKRTGKSEMHHDKNTPDAHKVPS